MTKGPRSRGRGEVIYSGSYTPPEPKEDEWDEAPSAEEERAGDFLVTVACIIARQGACGLQLSAIDMTGLSVTFTQGRPDARIPFLETALGEGERFEDNLFGWAPLSCSPGWAHLAYLIRSVASFTCGPLRLLNVAVCQERRADLTFAFREQKWMIRIPLEGREESLFDPYSRLLELFQTREYLRHARSVQGDVIEVGAPGRIF
ncbi:hypothetical protein [Streptomyces sp. MZ04]|uniref:hypothetical protein n=1 Tax=Streptomyces sp. MZ04 TaxID=2559236 RepID=UPI00107EC37F|nr:hypothetical protein [Streptomyces sp. MZ04]TGB13764.1 hypothetical protein E2651_08120 [Streptomyces sp. MZ04]